MNESVFFLTNLTFHKSHKTNALSCAGRRQVIWHRRLVVTKSIAVKPVRLKLGADLHNFASNLYGVELRG
jgi:hypothetical protein